MPHACTTRVRKVLLEGTPHICKTVYNLGNSPPSPRALLPRAMPPRVCRIPRVRQVLLEGSQAYKAVYGLPPLPEVAAWDPDAGLPEEQRAQGQYFFVMAGGQKVRQPGWSMVDVVASTVCLEYHVSCWQAQLQAVSQPCRPRRSNLSPPHTSLQGPRFTVQSRPFHEPPSKASCVWCLHHAAQQQPPLLHAHPPGLHVHVPRHRRLLLRLHCGQGGLAQEPQHAGGRGVLVWVKVGVVGAMEGRLGSLSSEHSA